MTVEPTGRVVITLHGIRTYGRWQERLRNILEKDQRWQHEERREVLVYKYGFFTLFSFLIPFLRNLAVKRFREYLESIFETEPPRRVDIIAHSFGTYLAIEALASPKLPIGVRIHTAILCGSVLPPNRNLSRLLGQSRTVGRVVNDCGIHDDILLLTLPILGVGMAGRLGLHGLEGRTLRNRYHRLGHSGYFERAGGRSYDGFMRRWWLPLLLSDELPSDRDRRPSRPPLSDRFWRLLGENDGTLAIALYAGILFSLSGTFAYLWREAVAQQKIAVANESHALSALSRIATGNHRSVDAVKLALAAWPRLDLRPFATQSSGKYRPKTDAALQALAGAIGADPGLTRRMRHDGPVIGAILTKDEQRLLSWSKDGTLRAWNTSNGRQIGPAMRHLRQIEKALLSSDDKRILSWDNNELRMWDATTGLQIGPTMTDKESIRGALITSDERHIISWGSDLLIWNTPSEQQQSPIRIPEVFIRDASAVMAGQRLVSWNSSQIIVRDVATGAQLGPTTEHDVSSEDCRGGYYRNALRGCPFDELRGAILTDDQRIISWGANQLQLADARTAKQIGSTMMHEGPVGGVRLTSDQKRILSWSDDGTLRIWDALRAHQLGPAMAHTGAINGAVFTADDRRILSWSVDGTLRLWDAASGRQIGPDMRHQGAVAGALLAKSQRRVLSWDSGGLHLWSIPDGKQISPTISHPGVKGALLSRDGRRIFSWSEDGSVQIADTVIGQQVDAVFQQDSVDGVLLNGDSGRAVFWSTDGSLGQENVSTGEKIGTTMKHGRPVKGAYLSIDKRRILSWDKREVRLWDAATGMQAVPSMLHPVTRPMPEDKLSQMIEEGRSDDDDSGTLVGEVEGALLADQDRRIVSWTNDGVLRLWDAATGREIGSPTKDKVDGVVPFDDRRRILTWGGRQLRLWDVSVGQPIGVAMSSDGEPIQGALLSHDERRILSWDRATLRLWDVATGSPVGGAIKYEPAVVRGALLTRDGRRIVAWGDDKLQVWDAQTGNRVGPPLKHNKGLIQQTLLSRDEQRILTWGADELRLWDAATGMQIGPTMKHDNLWGANFVNGQRQILSWGRDGQHLWDVDWPRGDLLAIACALLPEHELSPLSQRYGIELTEPICVSTAPLDSPLIP